MLQVVYCMLYGVRSIVCVLCCRLYGACCVLYDVAVVVYVVWCMIYSVCFVLYDVWFPLSAV